AAGSAKDLLVERRVGSGAHLVGKKAGHRRIVTVELGEFGRHVAIGHERAGAEIVLDRDIGRAADERGQQSKYEQDAHETGSAAQSAARVCPRVSGRATSATARE